MSTAEEEEFEENQDRMEALEQANIDNRRRIKELEKGFQEMTMFFNTLEIDGLLYAGKVKTGKVREK
jgi:hypothetical protein